MKKHTPPRDVASLLTEGRQCIEAYDYDAARRLLQEAFDYSDGGLEASLALLDLLVNVLALDATALSLEPRLSKVSAADPRVGALLASAAAREGRMDDTARLARTLPDEARRKVWVELTQVYLRREDAVRARQALASLQQLAVPPTVLLPLEDAFHRLCTSAFAKEEDSLQVLLEQEQWEKAQEAARTLLEAWPSSEKARKALKFLHEKRQALEAALEAEKSKSRLSRLAHRINHEMNEDGLRAYAALSQAERSTLLPSLFHPAPTWLEQLWRPLKAEARLERAACLDASAVLLRLTAKLATSLALADPEAALGELLKHWERLSSLLDAQRLRERLEAEVQERQAATAASLLTSLQEALSQRNLVQVRKLLPTIVPEHLSSAEREALASCERQLLKQEEVQRWIWIFERALKDDLLLALTTSRTLARWEDNPSKTYYQEQETLLVHKLKSEWGWLELPPPQAPVNDLLEEHPLAPPSWLLQIRSAPPTNPGQRRETEITEALVATAAGGWVCLRSFALESGAFLRGVLFRPPSPLSSPSLLTLGDDLALLSSSGACLRLEREGLLPLRLDHPLRDLSARGPITACQTSADGRTRYLSLEAPHARPNTVIWSDGQTAFVAEKRLIAPIRGSSPPMALMETPEGQAYMADVRGTPQPVWRLPPLEKVLAAAMSPSGGKLALVAAEVRVGRSQPLELFCVESSGRILERFPLPGSTSDQRVVLLSDVREGLLVVRCLGVWGDVRLHAFVFRSGRLEPCWQKDISPRLTLLERPGGTGVFALVPAEGRYVSVPLTAEGPFGRLEVTGPTTAFPSCHAPFSCLSPLYPLEPEVEALVAPFLTASSVERQDLIARLRREARGKAHVLQTLARALLLKGLPQDARVVRDLVVTYYPESGDLQLERAESLMEKGDLKAALRLLTGIAPLELGFYAPAHRQHLLGCVLLRLERPEEALQAWQEEWTRNTPCHRDEYRALLEPLSAQDPGLFARTWAMSLRRSIQASSEALERQDIRAARRSIDSAIVWTAGEVQSLSRLAEVALHSTSEGILERFWQTLALAHYLEAFAALERGGKAGRELPTSEGRWRRRRLADLERRVRAKLGQPA